jgi:hypothetical protein
METIVIRSRGPEADPWLVQTLLRLFPGCRVRVVPADERPESPESFAAPCDRAPSRFSRIS